MSSATKTMPVSRIDQRDPLLFKRRAAVVAASASAVPSLHSSSLQAVVQVLVESLHGRTISINVPAELFFLLDNDYETLATLATSEKKYEILLQHVLQAARNKDFCTDDIDDEVCFKINNIKSSVVLLHNGKIMDKYSFPSKALKEQIQYQLLQKSTCSGKRCYDDSATTNTNTSIFLQLKCLGRGGMDRQNRVGSKFGGGGVSSSQQSERERKERLKQLALESIDLAKDPYLMRNHLGTYECKLCLTLHTNEANYLSHTQGKKHQQGLARRAYLEKLKQEKEQQQQQQQQQLGNMSDKYGPGGSLQNQQKAKKIRIGRPAYQVFKSRDNITNQRCLSFELHYPEIEKDLQPRHRFMSAYEQRIEVPPDRRFQYLLFAAEPYETIAFKIPNEPIDKDIDKFVTHWDSDDKKFTLTLNFLEQQPEQGEGGKSNDGNNETVATTTVASSGTAAGGLGTVTVS